MSESADLKTVLITGASSGIGASMAQCFSQQKYEVLLVGRSPERLESVASQLPGPFHIFQCDFSQKDSLQDFLKKFSPKAGKCYSGQLTHLINNAGIVLPAPLEEATETDWTETFQVNFFSAVAITQCLIPLLKKNSPSSILNISSTLGIRPINSTGAYSASKAAMISWTQTLALELAPYQVRANCISPAVVDTPIHFFHRKNDNSVKEQMAELHPLGRVGTAEEISQAALFLTSPHSHWTTGTNLVVDGGMSLKS